MADLDRAIKLDPNLSMSYSNRGLCWTQKKKYDRAIADYNQAIKLDRNNAIAHNNLARLQATCSDQRYRDGEKALENASRAFQLEPEAQFMDTLAAAYAEKGDFEKAHVWLTKAIGLSTDENEKNEWRSRLELYKQGKPGKHPPATTVPPEKPETMAEQGPLRVWTDSTGKHTVEAEFVELKDGRVRLKKEDGKIITIPIDKLSEVDQNVLRSKRESTNESAKSSIPKIRFVYSIAEKVTVRAAPKLGDSCPSASTVPFGTKLAVTEEKGDWLHVGVAGKDMAGWVHKAVVSDQATLSDEMSRIGLKPSTVLVTWASKTAGPFNALLWREVYVLEQNDSSQSMARASSSKMAMKPCESAAYR